MITKEELNNLGFHRSIQAKNTFNKRGWQLWNCEVEPGDIYLKVAIRPDIDTEKEKDEWVYFYDIEALEDYLRKQEKLPMLQKCLDIPYPCPMYNDELYRPPVEGY